MVSTFLEPPTISTLFCSCPTKDYGSTLAVAWPWSSASVCGTGRPCYSGSLVPNVKTVWKSETATPKALTFCSPFHGSLESWICNKANGCLPCQSCTVRLWTHGVMRYRGSSSPWEPIQHNWCSAKLVGCSCNRACLFGESARYADPGLQTSCGAMAHTFATSLLK